MFYFNKKSKIIWLVAFLLATTALLTSKNFTYANTKIEEKLSQTQSEVEKLFEIKDNTEISQEEKEKLEKESRIKIIFSVIDLSQIQLEELSKALKEIPDFPEAKDWQKIREQFFEDIKNSQKYLEEKRNEFKEISEKMEIKELKDFAKNLEEEKKAKIDPFIEQVSDVITIFDLSEIIKIADQRLEKVKSDIDKIYSKKLTQSPTLKNLLIQTTDYINNAHQYNDRSKEIILKVHLIKDEKDDETVKELIKELRRQFGKIINEANFNESEKEEGHKYVRELTILAFEKIKSSYELFVRMSVIAKQLIK